MPIYCYVCDVCEGTTDQLRPVETRNNRYACPEKLCAGHLQRDVSRELPAVPGSEIGFTPYFDPSVGKQINSRPERDSEFKRLGLVPRTYKEQVEAFERNLEKPVKDYKFDTKRWGASRTKAAKKLTGTGNKFIQE